MLLGGFAARVHARMHSGGGDRQRAVQLYTSLQKTLTKHEVGTNTTQRIIYRILPDILDALALAEDHPQARVIGEYLFNLLETEQLFSAEGFNPQSTYSEGEYWDHVQVLSRQLRLSEHFEENLNLLAGYTVEFFTVIYDACPALVHREDGTVTLHSSLMYFLREPATLIEKLMGYTMCEELKDLLGATQQSLEHNLVRSSGGSALSHHSLKYPTDQNLPPPELVRTYLGGTVIAPVFNQDVSFSLPLKKRFEHHHLVGGSGHGKTQTLQYLIAQDLSAVAEGKRSVVVMDSQGDLLNNISHLSCFSKGGALADRIVIIDPSDVEFPLALNLFDVGQSRLSAYSPLERERLTNSILELYDFVLSSLLDAGLTQKQNVIFRFVMRLVLTIPQATIHTFREIMQEGSEQTYGKYFTHLEGSARHFFEQEFSSREFAATRRQVLRRLWGILENATFERMFSHPTSKLDLFSELNSGKVILINTAKDLLQETGTELFGRFFIALIAQAAQERATLSQHERMPTLVYIDEAADYFDQSFSTILSQARKYKVGMVLAHQYLGQLEPRLQEAFAANTSIKMAGGVSTKDARALAPTFHTSPEEIERQSPGSFACHIRGVTPNAVPVSFPFGYLERMSQMSKQERYTLQERMRERYATPLTPEAQEEREPQTEVPQAGEPTKGW